MVNYEKLIGHQLLQAPVIMWVSMNAALSAGIASVAAAGISAGVSIHNANKQERAAESAERRNAATNNARRAEAMDLEVQKGSDNRARAKAENASKNMMDDEAAAGEMSAMSSAANNEKSAREQERLLASQQAENEYASKFKPGAGGLGEDSASDFLVPKVADNTGLVRDTGDKGGNGLIAEIGFGG